MTPTEIIAAMVAVVLAFCGLLSAANSTFAPLVEALTNGAN